MFNVKFSRIFFLLVFAVCLFVSCQTRKINSNDRNSSGTETSLNSDSKNLVVFFSRAGENWQVGNVDVGNTAVMAGYINDRIDADVFEIKAKEPYLQSYDETLERATKERNENARPELLKRLDSIEKYDNIFLGFPTWWGDCPMIVLTFLEDKNLDFRGKTIIPFNTAGGSGFGSGLNTIKEKLKNSTFKEGLTLTGVSIREESSRNKVNKWLEDLGFEKLVKYQK